MVSSCVFLFLYPTAETVGGMLRGCHRASPGNGTGLLQRICVSVGRLWKSSLARPIYVGSTCVFVASSRVWCFQGDIFRALGMGRVALPYVRVIWASREEHFGRAPSHVGSMCVFVVYPTGLESAWMLRGCHSVSPGNGSGMRYRIRVSFGPLGKRNGARTSLGRVHVCFLWFLSRLWTVRGWFQSVMA